jgi:hypothetical protein
MNFLSTREGRFMSNEPLGNTTRRGFLGTATAATALTLTAPTASEAQAVKPVDEIQIAQLTSASPLPATTSTSDWAKPAAMAIPKEGYFKLEQGRYGPVFPKTPANYGFTIIAKIKPGREQVIREYGKKFENAVAESPSVLAPLKLHYLRWVLFSIGGETYFMFQGIFDADFDKLTEDAVALFITLGANTTFENLEGFPMDWKTNIPGFVKFVREHRCPSFLEYGEYPYVTAEEVKKALRLKSAVEHVHVNEGGQAVIGNVKTR